jgi:hypothetical protein
MRTQEGNLSLCLKKVRLSLEDSIRLASGRKTKEQEKVDKIRRNNSRNKYAQY